MYNKERTILSDRELSLERYIEKGDIFNSKFLYMLPKLPSSGEYTIDLTEFRIDLISLDLYDSTDMSEILLFYNGLTISELSKGTIINVPYLGDVRNLLKRISSVVSPREYLKDLEG